MNELLPYLIMSGAAAVRIAVNVHKLRRSRERIGDEVVEVRLSRRGADALRWICIAAAVAMPIVSLAVGGVNGSALGDIEHDFLRSLPFVSYAFLIGQSGRLVLGEYAVMIGPKKIIDWDDIESVRWDRDIGQSQWGMSIHLKGKPRSAKERLYVRRDLQPRVDEVFVQRMRILEEHTSPELEHAV
jgi:hypothetical protein